jgi:hypothetical protein
MNDRPKMIDDSAARHVSGKFCFGVVSRRLVSESCVGVLLRSCASASCFGIVRRRLALELFDSTQTCVDVTRVWGLTAKHVIDKHPRLCFATPLQSRMKTWLTMHPRLCFMFLQISMFLVLHVPSLCVPLDFPAPQASCFGLMAGSDSGQTAEERRGLGTDCKSVIDKHTRLCFAPLLQSRMKTWLIETPLVSPMILIGSLDRR